MPGRSGDSLSHLVVERKLSAATQQQALSALLFLYRNVIGRSLEELGPLPRGRVPTTLPVVLTRAEVERVLGQLRGIHRLVGMLLYGSGLRVTECLQLRIKDVDLERRELLVRRGKGGKDRVTVLPERVSRPIAAISWASRHCTSVTWPRVAGGWRFLGVWMPSIRRRAGRGPGSGCSRPAGRIGIPKAGGSRRHHLHESVVQRAMTAAVRRSGIGKRASCHTLRHSFATHLLRRGMTFGPCRSCSATGMWRRR